MFFFFADIAPPYCEEWRQESLESNPLSHYEETIPFNQLSPSHFLPLFITVEEELKQQIKQLEKIDKPSFTSLIPPIEEIEQRLNQIIGPLEHLKNVKASEEIRNVWREIEPRKIAFTLGIEQNPSLYQALQKIKEEEWNHLSTWQKRIIEKRITQAENAGIGLKKEEQERFKTLVTKLHNLQEEFNSTLLKAIEKTTLTVDNPSLLKGVPFHTLCLTAQKDADPEKGPWTLTTIPPIYGPIMRHCQNRDIRKALYLAKITLAATENFDNSNNLRKQLSIRKKIAALLGVSSYAEHSLKNKMAEREENAKTFLKSLKKAARDRGKKEIEEVISFAKKEGFTGPFMPWDLSYFAERLKEKTYQLSEGELKKYFPLPKVLEGLFNLVSDLFDISIHPATDSVSVWHSDVSYYILKTAEGEKIGSFYLDPYSRPATKRGGAWMESCQNRFRKGKTLYLPIAYVVCNATPPIGKTPALLGIEEVKTLFHEFGHALQHMLTQIDYTSIAGINGVEWDAVEIISQFMENWLYHSSTLKRISSHVETEKPLPDELIDQIQKSRNFLSSTSLLFQIGYSMADLALHHQFNPKGKETPFALCQKIFHKTFSLPPMPEDRFLCCFHHIFGGDEYAAGYYSYLWAKVISSDIFAAFEEAGLHDPLALKEVGRKLKKTFLEKGGSADPMTLFLLFRGRKPSLEPFLNLNLGVKTSRP